MVLESLQASASAKIRTLELSAESRRRLWVLLQEATALKVGGRGGLRLRPGQGGCPLPPMAAAFSAPPFFFLQENLLLECGRHVAQGDSLATALQADWAQMRLDVSTAC